MQLQRFVFAFESQTLGKPGPEVWHVRRAMSRVAVCMSMQGVRRQVPRFALSKGLMLWSQHSSCMHTHL